MSCRNVDVNEPGDLACCFSDPAFPGASEGVLAVGAACLREQRLDAALLVREVAPERAFGDARGLLIAAACACWGLDNVVTARGFDLRVEDEHTWPCRVTLQDAVPGERVLLQAGGQTRVSAILHGAWLTGRVSGVTSPPPRTRHARSSPSDAATIRKPATPATSDWVSRSCSRGASTARQKLSA